MGKGDFYITPKVIQKAIESKLSIENLSPKDRSSKEKDKKILEEKNDALFVERNKIVDERHSNRRNYQLDIRNIDSRIKDLRNDSERMKRDRNKILNIGDMDANKLRQINSEIDD